MFLLSLFWGTMNSILAFLMHMHTSTIKTMIGVVAGLAIVALFFWSDFPVRRNQEEGQTPVSSQDQSQATSIKAAFNSISPVESEYESILGGVRVYELVAGEGAQVLAGSSVAIHYTGRFENNVQFDSSIDRGQPLLFVYGQKQLIPGLEAGLEGARVGSIRRVVVPATLGYGVEGVVAEDGTVIIPPNATLIFDVAVISSEE